MSHGQKLVAYARAKVREALGGGAAMAPEGPWCDEPGATFVTVRWRADPNKANKANEPNEPNEANEANRLQGCIGSLEPRRALVKDVARNAISAALDDPRATPITLDDVDALEFELSLLSPLEPVSFTTEASVADGIEVGKHGVVIGWGMRRATFLPSMWEHFRSVPELMSALKEKAGLPADFWNEGMQVWRYTVEKYVDPAPRKPALAAL